MSCWPTPPQACIAAYPVHARNRVRPFAAHRTSHPRCEQSPARPASSQTRCWKDSRCRTVRPWPASPRYPIDATILASACEWFSRAGHSPLARSAQRRDNRFPCVLSPHAGASPLGQRRPRSPKALPPASISSRPRIASRSISAMDSGLGRRKISP